MFKRLIAVGCAACLAGCANGNINTVWPFLTEPGAAARVGASPLREHQVDLRALLVSEFASRQFTVATSGAGRANVIVVSGDDQTTLDQLIAAVDQVPRREQLRNDVAGALIAASTANCNIYLQAVRSGQVSSRLASDFFAGAFATASSIATPARSADILAGLSALSTAAGSSVDRNIFAQQGAELVAEAILTQRDERRTGIETQLTRSYETYPMGMALADLYEFHGDCSMLRGMTRLREAITTREQTVQAIRSAALAVERSGGSAHTVVSVLAGLTPTNPPPPAEFAGGATDADLRALRAAGADCIDAAFQRFAAQGTEDVAADIGALSAACPAPKEKEWRSGYQQAARGALTDQGPAIQAALQPLQDGTPEARTTALAALKTAVHQAYAQHAEPMVASNLAARALLLQILAAWPTDRSFDDLKNAIKGLGGSLWSETPGLSDPVFTLALGAAEQLKNVSPDSSTTVLAQHARRAAISYMTPPREVTPVVVASQS